MCLGEQPRTFAAGVFYPPTGRRHLGVVVVRTCPSCRELHLHRAESRGAIDGAMRSGSCGSLYAVQLVDVLGVSHDRTDEKPPTAAAERAEWLARFVAAVARRAKLPGRSRCSRSRRRLSSQTRLRQPFWCGHRHRPPRGSGSSPSPRSHPCGRARRRAWSGCGRGRGSPRATVRRERPPLAADRAADRGGVRGDARRPRHHRSLRRARGRRADQ